MKADCRRMSALSCKARVNCYDNSYEAQIHEHLPAFAHSSNG